MAETVAIELVKVVFQQLADKAFKMYARSQGIHNELKRLESTLSWIQDRLNDASEQEVSKKSVKEWLDRLQHLAYDIDDFLDELATEAMDRELTPEALGSTSKVTKLIPTCCTNFLRNHRLFPKLDSINRELEYLKKENPDLIVRGEKPKNTGRRNETSLPDASRVVGRKREIEKLLNKLLRDESSKENFSFIPIVGMGGVGKTTLARLLYNDPQVNNHFKLKAWVCVSDDFDILKISNTILQSVTRENKEYRDLNQLQVALTEQLKDNRFLLVVDDVWSENDDEWENLVRPFYSCTPGSRIIMTTRNNQMLKKLGFHHLDCLECLSHEDALSLFALHSLGVDNFDSHTTLRPQGEGIVKKCAGLPLALKAIGRLLRTRTNGNDWDGVLNSEIWNLENKDNKIVPALRLSYHNLSADLKQLFAYCSLFPKDFLFDKEELVLLWMAEGFLNPSDVTKSPESLGHDYFEILLSRSFFQHAPNEESLFMMHDLMNDLATFVAGEFFLRFENHMKNEKKALTKHRYMSFACVRHVGRQKFELFKRAISLRTLLMVPVNQSWGYCYLLNTINLVDLLSQLPQLRVLSLSSVHISEVPEFIGSLKHLRYLNLSKTIVKELPDNVGNLFNLQTLIVFGCKRLTKLPKSFLNLKKLRHLDIRDTPLLKKLPLGIDELESLHTLTKIIIEGDDGFEICKLKGLKYLNGKVSIEGLHKVQSSMHARDANLSIKRITKLGLEWTNVFDGSRSSTLEKEVLNELKPYSERLKELEIVSYGGNEFSRWVGDPSFLKLVNVLIHGCRKCTILPPLGQLPSLKKLFIEGLNQVKFIGSELTGSVDVAFPSLETLKFENMPSWEVWSTDSKEVFPCLRELYIKNCGNLVEISVKALPSLRVLEINNCGDGVLKNLVKVGSSITKLEIESISGLTDEVWRDVMKYLGTVEDVRIWRCNEIRYLWESEEEASKVLVNVKNLSVKWCNNLFSLGEKEEEDNFRSNLLSSLRMLEIWNCNSLECCFCPNSNTIESLKISYCDSITRVFFSTIVQKLKSLVMYGCKNVKMNNTSMPMLEVLTITRWENLKSIVQLSNCSHLTRLIIESCPSIASFHDLHLSNLTFLLIHNCKNLESLPELSNLTLLKSMEIRKCPNMDCSLLRGLWPPNLCSLEIGALKKPITECGVQNYPSSLVELTIWYEDGVSDFSQFPHVFPSSLIELSLKGCDNLESLSMGLQHLESLQHLSIKFCPKMKHLPETLLPSLLSLIINGCPDVEERCKGRGSHYWPLISHIPCIDIDFRDL